MPRARAAIVSTIVVSLSFASVLMLAAADASAYRMWLEADRDVSTMAVGDVVTLELHLDTEGKSDILLLSVGTLYDPYVMAYDASASMSSEYALYGPGQAKGQTSSYLAPFFSAPYPWQGTTPAGYGQINADYFSSNFAPSADVSLMGTVTVSDDELLATLVFQKIAEGDVGFLLSGIAAGNTIGYNDDAGSFVNGRILDTGSPIGVATSDWLLGKNPTTDPGDTGDPNDPPTGGGGGDTGTGGGGGGTGTGDPVGAVPEPTAALLFGVGAVVFARRRIGRGR